jgi:nicotinamidase-related amidase
MTNRALVLIDLQNDYFPDGKLPLAGIDAAAANAAQALAIARTRGDAVIHVRHEIPGDGAPFFVAGSPGAAIHPSVQPAAGEPVVTKHHTNAFRETPLAGLLAERDITHVVIAGAMSHMCIDAATRAAADLGLGVTVLHDACATRDLEFGGRRVAAADVHAAFMAALTPGYATLLPTAEWIDT